MKKKVLMLISIIFIGIIIYFGFYYFQNYQFISNYNKYIDTILTEKDKQNAKYKMIRCNRNIFKPEFAFISGREDVEISFHKPPIFLVNNVKETLEFYVGGTSTKNTTFPQLLKMVKEDCYQFQKSFGNYNDQTINWSYGKYKPKPKKTKEEIEERKKYLEEYYRKLESGEIKPNQPLEGFVEYNADGTIKETQKEKSN